MFKLLLELILMVAGLFLVVVGSFCAACFCVGLLTGCDMDTAAEKVRKFGKNLWTKYKERKVNSPKFEKELLSASEYSIRTLVGEQRYQQHCDIAESDIDPLLIYTGTGDDYNLSYIANSVYYVDDNEKQRITSKLTDVTKKHLKRYGCDTRILTEWRERPDLHMPVLLIYYAKTEAQKKILDIELAERRNKIVAMNTAVVDDTEAVDLF